jgi:HEPN domain-containing protein
MNVPDDERKREAARWLKIAGDDQAVAQMCLNMVPPTIGVAGYHCQQSAEKLIKGMLVAAGVHFPKTHDLRALADLAEAHFPSSRDLFTRSIPLTGWGYAYRYPGLEVEPPPDAADLLSALVTIDQLVSHMRDLIAPYGN